MRTRDYKLGPQGPLAGADTLKRVLTHAEIEAVETNPYPGANNLTLTLALQSVLGLVRVTLPIHVDTVFISCSEEAAHTLKLTKLVRDGEDAEERLALDTDLSNVARAIHRVVRAMNDGECPKCHVLDPVEIGYEKALPDIPGSRPVWSCNHCLFEITYEQAQAAMRLFASKMEGALAIFEEWRAGL